MKGTVSPELKRLNKRNEAPGNETGEKKKKGKKPPNQSRKLTIDFPLTEKPFSNKEDIPVLAKRLLAQNIVQQMVTKIALGLF